MARSANARTVVENWYGGGLFCCDFNSCWSISGTAVVAGRTRHTHPPDRARHAWIALTTIWTVSIRTITVEWEKLVAENIIKQ